MPEAIVILLLITLDVIAIVITFKAASNASGYITGAICGVVAEIIRFLITIPIIGTSTSSEAIAWLANFRVFNIPILIGIGFMAGSASSTNQVSQEVTATQTQKRYCVICQKEWGPHYEKCCTENSLVARGDNGVLYAPDGRLLDEKDLSELREREINVHEQKSKGINFSPPLSQ